MSPLTEHFLPTPRTELDDLHKLSCNFRDSPMKLTVSPCASMGRPKLRVKTIHSRYPPQPLPVKVDESGFKGKPVEGQRPRPSTTLTLVNHGRCGWSRRVRALREGRKGPWKRVLVASVACQEMGDELVRREMGSIMEQLAGRCMRILRSQGIQTRECFLLHLCEGKHTTREKQRRQLADSHWGSHCWECGGRWWVCNAYLSREIASENVLSDLKG